jgi:type II secretory pathway pseudopilin PulG
MSTPQKRHAIPGAPSTRPPEGGFSLIEVLIASVLLLFIALGIIPMFVMAMQSNVAGQDHTLAANHARGRLEQLMQLPFDDPILTITAGTERGWTEIFDESTDSWILLVGDPPDNTNWLRQTTIRQFDAEELDPADAISATEAAADPTKVQLKEITVEVFSHRLGGIMGAKEMTVTAYKAA